MNLQNAYTLIEVMLALTLLSILMLSFANFMQNTQYLAQMQYNQAVALEAVASLKDYLALNQDTIHSALKNWESIYHNILPQETADFTCQQNGSGDFKLQWFYGKKFSISTQLAC